MTAPARRASSAVIRTGVLAAAAGCGSRWANSSGSGASSSNASAGTLGGRLGAVDPSIGPQCVLPPYATAFLETAAVQLGCFNVVGMIFALYLLIVGVTGLQLLGAQPWISVVFNGAALVVAVPFAQLTRRRVTV